MNSYTFIGIIRQISGDEPIPEPVQTTLTLKTYDGSEIIRTITCIAGTPIESIPTPPDRQSTAQYNYTPVGWSTSQNSETATSGATSNVTEDRTVFAAYSKTVRSYTATFVRGSDDGSGTLYTCSVEYGQIPVYAGETPTSTRTGYTFSGWSPAISAITENTTYTAVFEQEQVVYNVYFYNGSTLMKTEQVPQGGDATPPAQTPIDLEHPDYEFVGWQPGYTNIQADTTCYAQFEESQVEPTNEWDAVIASVNNGTYKTKYNIGDLIPLDLGTEGTVAMQIVAMDTDELASGSGTAPITFISQQLLKTNHRMNPAKESETIGTGTLGGWEHTEMRAYLKDTIKPLIPSNVRSAIKEVKKYSRLADGTLQTTTDDVWIPSRKEVAITSNAETSGPTYSVFSDNESRIKMKTGTSSGSSWWLRSAYSATTFGSVSTSGASSSTTTTSRGVALGFCL